MLKPEHISDYQQHGAVCIRQLLSPQEIELLRNGIDFNLQNLSTRAKIASQADDPGRFIEDFCNWNTNPYYHQFIFESSLGHIAARLMQSNIARLYHDHMLVKQPHTRQATPWHQDQPYYNIAGMQNCSMWIPVDPVTRYSTLEFIAGSHTGPWFMPRTFMDNQARWFPEGSLAELPNIEAQRHAYPIIGWDVNPGDVVCFHMLALHAARGVTGDHHRRVFSLRFLGDDMVHAPRPWKTSPEFPNLDKELLANAMMDHPLFPVLWREDNYVIPAT